jgi:2-C-methyl-D-erythritol 2,4-cyclodiphosphate synthase
MMRVGLGYDIHRTQEGRRLILGGVEIPSEFGLEGHSDADVVVHALMDAMLGAAGLGDIGRHFPPGDGKYRDVSSLALLVTVSDLVRGAGFSLVNVDIVVVAERPRLASYTDAMRRRIGGAAGADPDYISIKATTNERLGPEGRGEGISAWAVALLERAT